MSHFDKIPPAMIKAAQQLTDPKFIGVILKSVGLMLLITGPFFLIFVGIASFLQWIMPEAINLPMLGEVGFLGIYTKGLASKSSWIFWTYIMAPIALTIVSFFLDTIADAVEKRHYPNLPTPKRMNGAQTLGYSIRFLGLTALISIAALIASLFVGMLGPIVFIGANGYLMAREYLGTVAIRRMPVKDANKFTNRYLFTFWALGAGLAVLLNIPFLNLIVPVVGVAAFTHLFHQLSEPHESS